MSDRRKPEDLKRTVLIVEQDVERRVRLRLMLESRGYAVLEAAGSQEAARIARAERPELAFMGPGATIPEEWDVAPGEELQGTVDEWLVIAPRPRAAQQDHSGDVEFDRRIDAYLLLTTDLHETMEAIKRLIGPADKGGE